MDQQPTVLESEKVTTRTGRVGAEGCVAKTTVIESLQRGSLPPFCAPGPGGSFLDYRIVAPMKVSSGEADFFFLEHPSTAERQVLKLYRYGIRPKLEILGVISGLGAEHVVKLIRHGEVEGRHYEIQEYLPFGSLADLLGREKAIDESRVRLLTAQIADALLHLQAYSVLHRDVKPSNILVRTLDPITVVLSDFGISSVSDLSLHLTTMSRTPAYCAPEATTGVVTKSSDWWSLGVIILEMLTGAHPFARMSEQAINFQLMSRGITVPESLASDWVLLLRGLLTRNYQHRWGGSEVRRWLSGDRTMPVFHDPGSAQRTDSAHKPYRFLKAACEQPAELAEQLARYWPEASKHWAMGYVLRWVELEVKQQQMSSLLREIQGDSLLAADHKLGAALLAMHPDLPLVIQGNVLDEAACSSNPELAAALSRSSLGAWLNRLRTDDWLLRWSEDYRAAELAVSKLNLDPGLIIDPESGPDPGEDSATKSTSLRALLCTPLASLQRAAERRRAQFAGARDALLDTAFANPSPSRAESVHLLRAPLSQFFTESEACVERGLKSARAFGWRVDEASARRLLAKAEWPVLLPLWQKAREHANQRKRTPLEFSHPDIAAMLEQPHPPIEAAMAVLANRLEFQNTLGMCFVPVPGTRSFWSVWQTRVSDFQSFSQENPRPRKATSFNQSPDHPVVFVTWQDATDFCQWLTARERALKRIGPRDLYRLPTDLEWSGMAGLSGEPGATPRERNGAVRGIFPWGTAWPPPKNTANVSASLGVDRLPFTAPVGSFLANESGLHDLGSNVMEWCDDSYDVDLDLKVVRGASWFHTTPENCWSSVRRRFNGNECSDTLGFRCVLDYKVPPPASFESEEAPPVVMEMNTGTEVSKPAVEKNKPFWKIRL